MKTQPKLSASFLNKWLNKHYRMTVRRVRFMPRGECSWGFVLTAEDDRHYFLKLWQRGLCEHIMTASAVQTLMTLYYDFGLRQITPPPLRSLSSGQYINRLSRYQAALLHWVDGYPVTDSPLTPVQQRRLGALVGTLHNCKLNTRERPPAEDYSPQFIVKMRRILREIDYPDGFYTPRQSELLHTLRSARSDILMLLSEFSATREQLLQRGDERFVICHGDPSPGNIIITPEEQVFLIDWDAPLYAPPERDLIHIHHSSDALEGYVNVVEGYEVDSLTMRFYQLHWDVQEIVEYGSRTLYTHQSEAQNDHDITQLTKHLQGMGIL